ncbi:MAG: helix-hairpin-helix domain-containing protein [Anaerobutyricum sp.]
MAYHKKRAEAIVNKFGDNTFDVLIYQTELLQQIKGIGKKSIEKIKKCAKEKLEEQNMIQTIMMYIQGFGISPAYANRIYKRYGLDSIKVINENPYRLADEVKGIGFLKADEIALKNGMPKDSPFRVESAVMYVLKQMSEDGDVFGHREKVEKDCRDFLQLDISYVENAVKGLIQKKKIICEDDALYLIPLYKAETYAAKKIVELLQSKTKRVNVTKKRSKSNGKRTG